MTWWHIIQCAEFLKNVGDHSSPQRPVFCSYEQGLSFCYSSQSISTNHLHKFMTSYIRSFCLSLLPSTCLLTVTGGISVHNKDVRKYILNFGNLFHKFQPHMRHLRRKQGKYTKMLNKQIIWQIFDVLYLKKSIVKYRRLGIYRQYGKRNLTSVLDFAMVLAGRNLATKS